MKLDNTTEEKKLTTGNTEQHSPYVNSQLEEAAAKTLRLIGTAVILTLILWGLYYGKYDSPFEDFLEAFDIRDEIWTYVFAGIIGITGWYFRLLVGAFSTSLITWPLLIIGKIFKSI